MARPKRPTRATLSLSETRAELSELVRDIAVLRKVAITVRGEVKALLVAPDFQPTSRKPLRPLRGSMKLVGDLDSVKIGDELQRLAIERAKRAGLL